MSCTIKYIVITYKKKLENLPKSIMILMYIEHIYYAIYYYWNILFCVTTHQLRSTDMKCSGFMKMVTVSLCSQCCSPDKRYSEWRQAEDAGGNFTTCIGLLREPTQQVRTDCVFYAYMK